MKFVSFILVAVAAFCGSTAEAAKGVRYQKTVLNGVLIRAGGPGGQRSMSNDTLKELCEEGVSKAIYLYPKFNFSNPGTHRCSRGSIEYKGGGFVGSASRSTLQEIYRAAESGSGPVLVHCWNGWHAAGEIAAYSLIQFCGWSGDRAADYWSAGIQDKGNMGKYGSILKRIRNFQPFSDLRISESTKARICP